LGEYDSRTNPDCSADGVCADPVLDMQIEKVVLHEHYFQDPVKGPRNDIALLRLKQDLNLKSGGVYGTVILILKIAFLVIMIFSIYFSIVN
jgi:hypothetical protein